MDIEQIETELRVIDLAIAELQKQREAVLRSDPEYAAYLDVCETEPLPIRDYYRAVEHLECLNKKAMEALDEGGDIPASLIKEILFYERRVCA